MRREADLILVVACVIGLTIVILEFPFVQPARVALGLPFILFFPGYTLIAALFPRKHDLSAVERIGLSLGLSIAVVPLIALALNYSPWGIRLHPILAFVTLFIVLAAAVALFRRRLLPPDEASVITVRVHWLRQARMADALLALALLGVAAALGAAGHFVTSARGGADGFTEFYLLGPDGMAESHPRLVKAGERTTLTLGVVNHEGSDADYRVEVRVAGDHTSHIDGLLLTDSQRWENTISLIPTRAGDDQRVEALLYKGGGAEPYRTLHFWLDVEGAPLETAPRTEGGPSPTPAPSPAPPPAPATAEALPQERPPMPTEEEPGVTEAPQARVHVVVRGENLSQIAVRYEAPLKDVIAANDLDNPDLIFPQQKILIPGGGNTGQSE